MLEFRDYWKQREKEMQKHRKVDKMLLKKWTVSRISAELENWRAGILKRRRRSEYDLNIENHVQKLQDSDSIPTLSGDHYASSVTVAETDDVRVIVCWKAWIVNSLFIFNVFVRRGILQFISAV